MNQSIFIVGTGRCGSTMLTKILARYNDLLILSEFFITLTAAALKEQTLNGDNFWKLLNTPRQDIIHMFKYNLGIPEYLNHGNKHSSPMLITTLPFLTPDPAGLYTRIEKFIKALPGDSISNHYRTFFNWLCTVLNKKIWIERSGASLQYVENFKRLFPDAKFIHIVRDGRDCAISMSKHNAYKLAMIDMMIEKIAGTDPYVLTKDRIDREKFGPLYDVIPCNFDPGAYHELSIPLEQYAKLWCGNIIKGLNALKTLPAGQVHTLKYEDLIQSPEEELEKLLKFIGITITDGNLIKQMKEEIQKDKKGRWIQLDYITKQKITSACKVGLALLKYGIKFEVDNGIYQTT